MGWVFHKGTSDGLSRRDYKEDISSLEVAFKGMGNQGETNNRMPLSLRLIILEELHETMLGGKEI
jgi:hypothetical protein